MSVFNQQFNPAQEAAQDYRLIIGQVASTVTNRWPAAYPEKPEEYQKEVTRSRPKMDVNGMPTGEMESVIEHEPAIRMVPDIEASQTFFDGAGTDGLSLLIGHALVGNASNYTHLLTSGTPIPPAVHAAGMQFFAAALALRDACVTADILDALPVKVSPPVTLTPQPDGTIAVSSKD